MQVSIQKTIFLLLLGLLSTGLFSHDSYAGDPCVNDTDCKDSEGTVHACIFGECMYAYKSYQDVTCTSDTDCTLLNNPCNHFTCSDQGYCITQSTSSLSPGDTCKQNECGKATCDDYRKFCGIGFDAFTSQIEYLVTTSLGAACNDGDNNSCTVGACSKKDPTDPTKDIASKTNMICNSTAKDCSDALLCTVDSCDPSTGICAHPQKDCSAQGDQCNDGACSSSTGACIQQPKSGSCSDGSVCTLNDFCSNGQCKSGNPKDCNDGKPCTDDTCNMAMGCLHTNDNSNICPSDGNVCNGNEKCSNGQCIGGTQLNCDDGVACTDDACGALSGCKNTPNNTKCNDNVACTNDTCSLSGCANVPDDSECTDDGIACTVETCNVVAGCTKGYDDLKCNDNVECTDDSCGPEGCTNTPNNAKCGNNDGLACTDPVCVSNDGCDENLKAGYCVINNTCYADGDKNPTNPCQVCDSSLAKLAWSNVAKGTSCEDGKFCNGEEACSVSGQCVQSKPAPDCNDGLDCTTDSCSEAIKACKHYSHDSLCDDKNDCTNDKCDAATGCSHPFNTNACSDSNACTTPDVCTSGACAGGAPKDCNDTNPCTTDNCDTATGACTNEANATFTCTDPANPWCDVGQESKPICQYLEPSCHVVLCEDLIISASSDPMPPYFVLYANDPDYFSTLTDAQLADLKSNLCTGQGIADVNLAATYVPTIKCSMNGGFNYTNVPNQGDLKEETIPVGDPLQYFMSFTLPEGVKGQPGGNMVQCTVELAAIGKTTQACSAPFTVNACADAADCDDSNPCTNDSCNADGTCSHADVICDPTKPSECVAGSYKTYFAGTCMPDDIDSSKYECLYQDQLKNCDDGNDCTVDGCDLTQGGCVNTPDEGNFCSGPDKCSDYSCSASGQCESSPKSCPDDGNACTTEQCNATTGNCESIPSGEEDCCISNLDCEDNDVCTADSCNVATGACSHENVPDNIIACNDSNVCTVDDKCVDGTCQPSSEKLACNDNASNPCKIDSCDPIQGCVAEDVPNGTSCADTNLCNGDEVCADGACVAGTDVACDDDNRCTQDACTSDGSCSYTTTGECSGPPEWCDINALQAADQCTYKEPVCQVILCDDVIAKSEVKVPADMPAFFLLYSNNPDEFIDAATLADMKQKLCAGGQVVPVNLATMIVPTISCDAIGADGNNDGVFVKDPQNIQDGDLNHFAGKEFPHSYQNQVPDSVMKKTGAGSIQCGVSLDFGNPAFTKNAQCSADFQIADCSSAADCDDSNPCTDDSCSASGSCVHINNATSCDDGNLCTVEDVCDDGKCEPGVQKDCGDTNNCTDDSCDPVSGSCVNTPNSNSNCCSDDAACEDGNICTNDTCDLITGKCSSVNVDNWPGQMCNDLNACTLGDICTDGKCVGKDPKDCSDGNECTDDTCNPAVGCTNTNNANACDDSNACTTPDLCSDGACQSGAPLACDDKDACTDDSCNAATGACEYSPNKVCACKTDADCASKDKDSCTQNSCDLATHECVATNIPGCCNSDHNCPEVGPCQNKTCVDNICGAEPIDNCCESDVDCPDDGDKCTDEFCDKDAHVCISQGECEEFCPDGVSKPMTCYLVDHHLTAKPGEACLTCQDDAGNVILSWKNGGNICPPVLDVSQAPNGDVVVTFVPDHIFKFNTGNGDMKKFFFEPPLGLLQDIDLFEITAADGTTSNHAYVTTAAGGLYKGDLTSGNIVSVANTKKSGEDLQALAPYFVATWGDGKQLFLGHTTGIKILTLDENYQFMALGEKFTKEKGDGGDPHGFELYNGILFYGLMSYTQIFDSTNFANNFKVYDVYYSVKFSHDKMFTVDVAPEIHPELNYVYGQFSFAPINAADPKPWADVIKTALGIVGEDLQIPVQPVPNIAKMESGVALGQLNDVCGGTWDLAIPLDEICDGIDNDLDGLVDEDAHGNPMAEPMEEVLPGLCEKNQMICEKGKWIPDPGNYQPVDEICNNGFDDDCDGMVDEGCEGCTIGDTNPCGIKIGECEPGHTECIANESGVGVWTGVCEGGTGPVDEICGDNLDNDCDERVDENCCESKCCTTCCCCGITYETPATPPTLPTPPEKKIEDSNDPEVAAEAKEEPKPEIIAEDVTEDECIAKGGSFEVVKAADGKPTFKLNKDGTMELVGICWEATGSGCSLSPSAVRIVFNPVWLGLLSLFLLRSRKRDR